MKIALLQCNTVTGDVAGNVERIISTARQAGAAGADLVSATISTGRKRASSAGGATEVGSGA